MLCGNCDDTNIAKRSAINWKRSHILEDIMAEMGTILASLLILVMAFLLFVTVIASVLLLAYGPFFKK